jgi:transcriptional regulator with XRE-family HTH domain
MKGVDNIDPAEWGPLVFHIRSLRQWHGEGGMSQRELATLAKISPHTLRAFEECRDLPRVATNLLRLSLALQVPLEWLFSPVLVEKERAVIEKERQALFPCPSQITG